MTTTVSSRFGAIVPETIECPSWCTIEHDLALETLAGDGWINHRHTVVDRPDLTVIVARADMFAAVGRPGSPVEPAASRAGDYLRRHQA